MSQYHLAEVFPTLPDNILVKTFQVENEDILIVQFEGEYPSGSEGNQHGKFISEQTLYAIHVFDPCCLILDFRYLQYYWGNTLLAVFQDIAQFKDAGNDPNDATFPILILGSDLCRDGLFSLCGVKVDKPDWYFENLDECVEAAISKANFWLNN